MATYVIRRILWAFFLFIVATIITYLIFFVIPSDPAELAAGKAASPATIAHIRHELHLDIPIYQQYWLFISGLAQGQMGTSLAFKQPVRDMVISRVPITIGLAVYAMVLAALTTLVFGLLAAASPIVLNAAVILTIARRTNAH